MPFGTITSTFNTFGSISGDVGANVPGTLSGSVGVPGPAGAPGVGVPAGGLTGQILLKASDLSYDTVWADNSAETLTATVRNETGATLSKGTVVYISGAAGNKALVSKASAASESSSSKTFAILAQDIPNNQNGTAVTVGLLRGINTLAFTPGANLWLSTTAGEITQTVPVSPNHAVFLGNAVRIHATQGEIEVRIQNGLELGELHDVLITAPTNGQVLKYDAAQSLWVNGTDVGGVAWGGITGVLSSQTDLWNALGSKYDASNPAGYITASALAPYLLSSTAASTYFTIAAAAGKADLASPVFTGDPRAPTPATADNDTSIATTAFVKAQGYLTSAPVTSVAGKTGAVSLVVGDVSGAAPLASPALSGIPTTPTATAGTSTTQIASTAFVTTADNLKANLSGATFSGKVNFTPVAGVAGLNIGTGGTDAASTTAGDLWIASGGTNLNFRDGTGSWRQVLTTTQPGVIDISSTLTALRVTQRGTGDAIRVEDSTTPDATRFVVDQFGKVGVGVAPDVNRAINVDSNGIRTVGSGVEANLAPETLSFGDGNNFTYYSNLQLTFQSQIPYIGGTISGVGSINFVDGSSINTAPTPGITDAPSDGQYYVRRNGAWLALPQTTVYDINNNPISVFYNP